MIPVLYQGRKKDLGRKKETWMQEAARLGSLTEEEEDENTVFEISVKHTKVGRIVEAQERRRTWKKEGTYWFIKVLFSLPLFGILQCVGLFSFLFVKNESGEGKLYNMMFHELL